MSSALKHRQRSHHSYAIRKSEAMAFSSSRHGYAGFGGLGHALSAFDHAMSGPAMRSMAWYVRILYAIRRLLRPRSAAR